MIFLPPVDELTDEEGFDDTETLDPYVRDVADSIEISIPYESHDDHRETDLSNKNISVVPFQQQHVCKIQLFQWFLYLSETPCKLHAEDAELGTVRVSQQPVEMPDIQHDVDTELEAALVSQQLCELPHSPPVQAFAVRLVETFR
ncbi:uncharacterized protein TNCV_2135681 [Trichonephila clavipes]|nr:uncharacterized protein TNCV_2135681 [Trichonephila clavipes]